MGLRRADGPVAAGTVYNEIRRTVKGYDIPLALVTVGAQQTAPVNGRVGVESRPDLIWSAHDNLFTSGTLGRYSKILNSVIEKPLRPRRIRIKRSMCAHVMVFIDHHAHQDRAHRVRIADRARLSAVGGAQSDRARAGAHGSFARGSARPAAAACRRDQADHEGRRDAAAREQFLLPARALPRGLHGADFDLGDSLRHPAHDLGRTRR